MSKDATIPRGLVRGTVEFRRCPWVRPLVADYVDRFPSVASLFAGNPSDPAAWHATISRVQQSARHRGLVASILNDQLERRGAPAAALDAARMLGHDASIAIVTGQQAGLFGGPLYTVLKAVTAIQLARRISRDHHVPAVPLFWVDSEDHDWDEIRGATTLARDFRVAEVALPTLPGAGSHPVGSLVLDGGVEQTVAALGQTQEATEFTDSLLAALRARYQTGTTLGTAFASWIEELLGRHGLVVFDATDVRAKPIAADLFVQELKNPTRTSQLVREAAAVMRRLGHAPQVEPSEDSVNLFYLDAAGRRPIKLRDRRYVVGDISREATDLAAEAAAHPDRFSPNVILRPLVQDRLFPTACYIAGPSELAYQAQLGAVYREFGIEAPLLFSRLSATILDSPSARFLERHDVAFETLQARDESVLNQMLERQLPPSLERVLQETGRRVADETTALRGAVSAIDPTLAGAVDTTVDRIKETLKHLQTKIVHATKKKDETLRRQFIHTRGIAFPAGQPQERTLSVAYFANQYGLQFSDRLIEEMPEDTGRHYLLVL